GEKWLEKGVQCRLKVIPCLYYHHNEIVDLDVKPSPNLPNMTSIYLYPSLCFFEGTTASVGRGTDYPFQVVGHPEFTGKTFSFTPESREGAKNPPHLNVKCYGFDLRENGKEYFVEKKQLELNWLMGFYQKFPAKDKFF